MGTPARRNLNSLLTQLQSSNPADWPAHLSEAHRILTELGPSEDPLTIMVESIELAHQCAQQIAEAQLSESRRSTAAQFLFSCKRLANCAKPTRLRKETRTRLDKLAQDSFLDEGIDTETISTFFHGCQKVLGRCLQDKNTIEMLEYLGIENGWPGEPLQPGRKDVPTLPIVGWYEALPMKLRRASESSLAQKVQERRRQLTAHDIFRALAGVEIDQKIKRTTGRRDLLFAYLTQVAGIWKRVGFNVGLSNNAYNAQNLGRFPNFVERVLLSQFDVNHSFFDPQDEERLWDAYQALPEELKEAASESPKPAGRLISDRLLREMRDALKKIE